MVRSARLALALLALLCLALGAAGAAMAVASERSPTPRLPAVSQDPLDYAGSDLCAECHPGTAEKLSGTPHDDLLAILVDEPTGLGGPAIDSNPALWSTGSCDS